MEADNAVARAEEAEAKNKKLVQEILEKDQDIKSLTHRLETAESKLDETEGKLNDVKHVRDEHETSKSTNEGLARKIQLLEEELDSAEKNLKETVERCVHNADNPSSRPVDGHSCDESTQAPSDGFEGRAFRTPGAYLGAGKRYLGEEIRST